MRHENDPIATTLKNRAGADPCAANLGVALAAVCGEIDTALAPIIGHRGVAALYKRSLYVLGPNYKELAALHEDVRESIDIDALTAAIARLDDATAFAGSVALLQSFHALLASLVGSSLTGRLLDAVWDSPVRLIADQDPAL